MNRLVVIGSLVGDQMMEVPHLPERGGDVLAGPVVTQPGGAYNIVAAAVRLGLPTAVAGKVGTGPIGSMLTRALAALNADVLLPRQLDGDSGVSIGFIEPDGERTFVTSPGVEQTITHEDLRSVDWRCEDGIYVSGYDLIYPVTGPAVAAWLGIANPPVMLFDPGPLAADIPAQVLDAVLAKTTILSLNEREFRLFGGSSECLWPRLASEDAVIVLRLGRDGAVLLTRDLAPIAIEPFEVEAVDSTGAGDAHAGALLAALAERLDLVEAVERANVAAALAVTRLGSATGPTREEFEAALARHDPW